VPSTMRYPGLTLGSHPLLVRAAVITVVLLTTQSCREPPKPISPCLTAVLKHYEGYASRHVPDSEWQPIIEGELQKCKAEEKAR
jgi:hypothetical protein